jgi:hypothetical protein
MTHLTLIGIGTGNPDHLTRAAIAALNAADLILIPRKGETKSDLAEVRRAICAEVVTNPATRIVEFDLPVRNESTPDYVTRVQDWHAAGPNGRPSMARSRRAIAAWPEAPGRPAGRHAGATGRWPRATASRQASRWRGSSMTSSTSSLMPSMPSASAGGAAGECRGRIEARRGSAGPRRHHGAAARRRCARRSTCCAARSPRWMPNRRGDPQQAPKARCLPPSRAACWTCRWPGRRGHAGRGRGPIGGGGHLPAPCRARTPRRR